jgi:uncharacterized coiled-coil protein SlyX
MDTDTVVTETLSQTVARQAAEIERLRELLREIADYSGDSGVVARVREALGECDER